MVDMIEHTNGLIAMQETLVEAVNQCSQDSLAFQRVRFQSGRVENFRVEITTKNTPSLAVGRPTNILAVITENGAERDDRGTAREGGTVPDKGFMGGRVGGDENDGFRADMESSDGPILEGEATEERSEVDRGFGKQMKVSDERKR